jgi:hypothetical protein
MLFISVGPPSYRLNQCAASDMFSVSVEWDSTWRIIICSASGLYRMKFIKVWGANKVLLHLSPFVEENAARDILLLWLNYCYWIIMGGCIYGKNISLVKASFMKIAWTDLLAAKGHRGDTRYLPCTKRTERHTALIIFSSERAYNSE